MRDKEIHVKPSSGGWAIEVAGQKEPLRFYFSESQAIEAALAWAKRERKELVVYGIDGLVREKSNFMCLRNVA